MIKLTAVSILNNVIGPVMAGCSSSHTAGPYHISKLFRSILGELPKKTVFMIEPGSSLSCSYHEQGSDLAMIMGLLDIPITDPRFTNAFEIFPIYGTDITFEISSFKGAIHPNSIKIVSCMKDGRTVSAVADSTGGGSFLFRSINDIKVAFSGDKYHLVVSCEKGAEQNVRIINSDFECVLTAEKDGGFEFQFDSKSPIPKEIINKTQCTKGVIEVFYIPPIFFPICGNPIFTTAEEMLRYASEKGIGLGDAVLDYESSLLSISKEKLNNEMDRRLQVMIEAVKRGFSEDCPGMFLLSPTAHKIFESEKTGKLVAGGVHARACARALAAMQVNSGQGIVCAAPTAGSAGVLPGVMVTLLEDLDKTRTDVVRAMWAAGGVGLMLAIKGTFAAEVCGCQVEVGAAGAMGAAGIVEIADGSPDQAADAAAILFHNAMGLVCDLVQSMVEIPCHSRNGSFASQAFICADMILGGYNNYISLDDTIDSVVRVGHMLPVELRCTSAGGISTTKSALNIPRLKQAI